MTSLAFYEPPWDAPLDVNAEYQTIPSGATMKGLFLMPMVVEARRRGLALKGARDRYLPFTDYPLAEHARLLVESARAFYPSISTRRGLRKLGWSAQRAIVETVVGKVMWTAVDRVDAGLELSAKAYAITSPSSRLTIIHCASNEARVRIEGHCFLDSNHVGTLEGVLRSCNAEGTVAVRIESSGVGEFLIKWGERPSGRPSEFEREDTKTRR